jgi:hypothetical protein
MSGRGPEIRHGLRTASKAVRFQRDALPAFNDSNRAVGISFWALPIFIILQFMTSMFAAELLTAASTIEGVTEVSKDRPAGELTPVIALLSLIVRWLLPLVIAFEFARGMAVSSAWPRFVVAANWCAVLQVLPITAGAIAMQAVGAPPAALQVLLFVTMLWVIGVDWFVAKWALGVNGGQAAMLVGVLLASDAMLTQITASLLT